MGESHGKHARVQATILVWQSYIDTRLSRLYDHCSMPSRRCQRLRRPPIAADVENSMHTARLPRYLLAHNSTEMEHRPATRRLPAWSIRRAMLSSHPAHHAASCQIGGIWPMTSGEQRSRSSWLRVVLSQCLSWTESREDAVLDVVRGCPLLQELPQERRMIAYPSSRSHLS